MKTNVSVYSYIKGEVVAGEKRQTGRSMLSCKMCDLYSGPQWFWGLQLTYGPNVMNMFTALERAGCSNSLEPPCELHHSATEISLTMEERGRTVSPKKGKTYWLILCNEESSGPGFDRPATCRAATSLWPLIHFPNNATRSGRPPVFALPCMPNKHLRSYRNEKRTSCFKS